MDLHISITLIKMRNYAILALFVFVSCIYLYSINGIEYAEPDTGYYLVLAKSLSVGNGYRLISHPDNSFEKQVLPVYPMLLVPVFWFANGSYYIARLITVIFAIMCLPVIYLIARRFFDKRLTLYATFLMVLSPMFVIYARKILTDIPFLFFFLTFMLLVCMYQESKNKTCFIATLPFLVLLLFTRIVGIVILAVVFLYYLNKKQLKESSVLGIVMLFFVFYIFCTGNYYANPATDFSEFGPKEGGVVSVEFVKILLERFIEYFFHFIPMNLVSPLNVFGYVYDTSMAFQMPVLSLSNLLLIFGGLISVVAMYGLYVSSKKNLSIFEIITVMYAMAIIVEHHVTGNARLMLPILLFFIIYFIEGLISIRAFSYKVKSIPVYEITIIILILSSLGFSLLSAIKNHNSENPKSVKNYIVTADWIKDNTKLDDIIVVNRPFFMFSYSDRRSIDFSNSFNETLEEANRYNVGYIVLGEYYTGESNIEYREQLESNKNKFRERFSINNQYFVYEIVKNG